MEVSINNFLVSDGTQSFRRQEGLDAGVGLGTHLFVKVPRPGDSEVTFLVFELSCHYQSNHSKVEEIPLSALPKDTTKANLNSKRLKTVKT